MLDKKKLFLNKKQEDKSSVKVVYRSFSAAKDSDLTHGWLREHRNLNEIITTDLDKLRERGRSLARNSDYVVRYSALLEDNVVGPRGFILQSKARNSRGKVDEELCAFIEEQFKIWCERYCDFTRQQNFIDLCKSLIGSMPYDGEFLVYLVDDDRNPHGISLQRIDVDNIDTDKNKHLPDNSRAIVNGVELSSDWQRLAIHLRNKYTSTRKMDVATVLPYNRVIHGFKVTSANQTRGVPWIASGIIALHQLQGYMTSAVMAAQNGANNAGFVVNMTEPKDPMKELEQPKISQPLNFDSLPLGADFKQLVSQYPTEAFGPFVKALLQRIASGWGVSYSSLSGDLGSANYSSMRTGLLQERDRYINIQNWFINTFVDKVFEEWLISCYNKGLFDRQLKKTRGKIHGLLFRDWQPKRWDWVDPKNDAEAKLQLTRSGIVPVDALASSMGYDFRDNLVKMAKFQEFADKLGINVDIFNKDVIIKNKGIVNNEEADKTSGN